MAKQLVLSGNRIIAHGEDCFLSMGGTVICPDTGKVYQNATLAVCEGGIPADIDEVGYEYHAGEFVPCAPYGKDESGEGTLIVACKSCKTPRDSKIPVKNLPNLVENGLIFNYLPVIELPGNHYGDIVYGNGMFVAVNSYGGAYSKGGDVWESFTLPTSGTPTLAYGGGKFVAISTGSRTTSAAYSTDGETWTAAVLPLSARWTSVVYGGGKFVAVNIDNKTAYSADGETWTSGGNLSFSTTTGGGAIKITYGNGMFVVLCGDGGCSCSTDGVTWTAGENRGLSFVGATYGNGMFVALGSFSGEWEICYTANPATTNWEAATTFSASAWTDIDYNGEVFVAITSGTAAAYSADGLIWEETTLPEDNNLAAVTHDENRFIAVGASTKALDTLDGKDWRTRGSFRLRLCDGTDVTDEVKAALAT